ncbi:response regulator [Stella sp.]|uniref:response regulator n=1 Tax=Stella sp. TaxID=2912054 RepID=UPI0035AF65A0
MDVTILLLEDSQIDAELARSYLAAGGAGDHRVIHVADRAGYEAALDAGGIDIILADYLLPGFDGLQALAMARRRAPDVPFLFVSGVVGEEFATDALKQGATDYVMKRNLVRLPAAVERALAEARDRSERRRAEQALRASEVGLRLAVDAARLGLWDLDPATGRVACDRRCRTLFGILGDAEIDLETLVAGCHPGDRDAFRTAVLAATDPAGSGEVVEEHRTARPVGAERWVSTHGRAFFEGGRCTRVIGVVRDVTERKRTEAGLRRLNEALEERVAERTRERDQAWRLSRDLMVVKRLDTTPVALNPAWQELLGWREDELMAGRLADLVHPEDRSVAEALAAISDHGVVERFENRYRRRDGAYRWIAWTAARDDDLVYAIGRDVTEEKQATAELASAHRQLLAQIEERERIEATLRQMQRLEAVGQLTSGVAHDFNNLLTIILGNIGFIERAAVRGAPAEQIQRRLGHMRQAAERGAKLTSQLLSFSRRQRLEPKPTDLNETVESMRDLLQSTLGGSVQLRRELAPDLWPALVDPTQIELIILNLAINARDAMRVGGRLTIATANIVLDGPSRRPEEPGPGEYVVLSVADTGTGMTPDVLAKAFEPFFTTKKVGEGSGLGLAQVYGFAKQSGGGVGIDTVPDEGTTVRVYLPRAAAAAVRPADHDRGATADGSAGGRTILVVDDDADVREVTASRLRELGYRVLEAGSGGSALDILAAAPPPDLLLLDYAMPGMNGAEVAREVRQRRPGLPIMFVTGFADLGALAEIGEERIVSKPYTDAELAAKVRRALA